MLLSPFTGGLFFLALLGFAFALMALLPRLTMGAALFSSLCAMLFLSYWSVIMLEWMPAAAYVLMVGGLICLGLGLGLTALGRWNLRARVPSVSLWAYLFLCALFVFLSYDKIVDSHDAYSFWARAVKELFTFDRSYFNVGNNMSHMDYPPVMASLQYAIVRVWGWQDGYLAYVPIAMVVVSACWISEQVSKKAWQLGMLILTLLAYTALFFFTTLTADGPMCMVFLAALLGLLYAQDAAFSSLLPCLCALGILPGLKIYSGLLFALMLAAAMLLGRSKNPPDQQRVPRRFAALALALLLLMQFSWSAYYLVKTRQVTQEKDAAYAAYMGEPAAQSPAPPDVSLGAVLSGNQRTTRFFAALTPETATQVGQLIASSMARYLRTPLPLLLLFLLPWLWAIHRAKGVEKRRAQQLLILLLLTALVYLLGFFAALFVQAEVSGGMQRYLSSIHLPLLIASLLVLMRTACQAPGKEGWPARIVLGCCVLGLLLLVDPSHLPRPQLSGPRPYGPYAQHARSLFEEELAPWLTPEDQQARAVLLDSTAAATELRSESGVTHAYQYFALPMRVSVFQFEYGNEEAAAGITTEILAQIVEERRCNLLLVRAEADDLFAESVLSALNIETYASLPWVFDVARVDGETTFTLRNSEEE